MTENYFEFLGNKIWYAVEGDLSNNPPLIVVHGGPGAPHNYLLTLSDLADTHPVIYYDQLNCGKSDRNPDKDYMTLEYLVEELNALIEHLNLKKYHLYGQSFGGTLVMEFLLEKGFISCMSATFASPALSAQKFVIDARKCLNDLSEASKQIIIECEEKSDYSNPKYAEAVDEYFSKHVIRNNCMPELINDTMNNFGTEIYNYMWGPSEFTLTGTLKDYDRTSELNKLFIPVLLTCGKYDEVTPETLFHYQAMFYDARLAVFNNSAHIANIEEREVYISTVRSFLDSFIVKE